MVGQNGGIETLNQEFEQFQGFYFTAMEQMQYLHAPMLAPQANGLTQHTLPQSPQTIPPQNDLAAQSQKMSTQN